MQRVSEYPCSKIAFFTRGPSLLLAASFFPPRALSSFSFGTVTGAGISVGILVACFDSVHCHRSLWPFTRCRRQISGTFQRTAD